MSRENMEKFVIGSIKIEKGRKLLFILLLDVENLLDIIGFLNLNCGLWIEADRI